MKSTEQCRNIYLGLLYYNLWLFIFYSYGANLSHSTLSGVDVKYKHECQRTCEWPPQPKTCIFYLTIEWFYSMSVACNDCPINKTDCAGKLCIPLNGVPRPIMVGNKMFPGRAIEVNYNYSLKKKFLFLI